MKRDFEQKNPDIKHLSQGAKSCSPSNQPPVGVQLGGFSQTLYQNFSGQNQQQIDNQTSSIK